MSRIHYRSCNLCEAMCGIAVEIDGARVKGIRGDDADPFSAGYICPKAVALADIHEDPDRLRQPQRRDGRSVSWERALDATSQGIAEVQRAHGRDAVAVYVGNPVVHNLGAMLFGLVLFDVLRTRNRFSATSVDHLPHLVASHAMFGHQLLLPVPDVDRTLHMLLVGANPLVSNGSLMTAPGVGRRLRRVRERGGKVVVIDPRRTETAAAADEHVFIRPGTDALLLASLVREIFLCDAVRLGHLQGHVRGVDALREAVQPFTPEAVAGPTGVDPAVTRRLADELARAERAVCYGRVGLATQRFGGLGVWLVQALNVLTGRLDAIGGAMFTRPAVDLVGLLARLGQRGGFGKGPSSVPEFGGERPVAVLADEIEAGRIKALITVAGNPVLSTPNGLRLERAIGKLELYAAVDIYRNETTQHAHFILPGTSALEQSHYDLALHVLAVRNTAKYAEPALRRPEGALDDWQILGELARRVAAERGVAWRVGAWGLGALLRIGPDGLLDALLRIGPYGPRVGSPRRGLTRERLAAAPHGVDLGALEPCLPGRLHTPDKRVDLAPLRFVADLPRLRALLGGASPGGLLLVGRREQRSNNSWLHNSARMVRGAERCTLRIHPIDAAARGLETGERARVHSRVGEIEVGVEVTTEVMPGVVCLPHGWGHRKAAALRVASRRPGASYNDVSDERQVDELTGVSVLNGVAVEVVRAEASSGG